MTETNITETEKKYEQLKDWLREQTKENTALAFSGGVDSSLLLYLLAEAAKENKTKVYAVTFSTRLHAPCDLKIAKEVVSQTKADHVIIEVDELEQAQIRENPENRCYLCKKQLFSHLVEFARKKGIRTVMEGSNEDDMHVYRPGIQAVRELGVKSPLAQFHITKQEVKKLAAEYQISVANRPSTPCMATRLPYGEKLDYPLLDRIARGEEWLGKTLGGNIRLRVHKNVARLEVDASCFEKVLEKRQEIIREIKKLGFSYVTLDLEGFRSGSMDETLENKGESL